MHSLINSPSTLCWKKYLNSEINLSHSPFNSTDILLVSQSSQTKDEIDKVISDIFSMLVYDNLIIRSVVLMNLLIFLSWCLLPEKSMRKHFLQNKRNKNSGRWWSAYLSQFSHYSITHIGGNMAAFRIFGPQCLEYLGTVRFCLAIIISGIVSAISADLWYNSQIYPERLKKKFGGSLGFSGINSSLFVLYALNCKKYNHTFLLSINGKDFVPPTQALIVSVIGDSVGLIISVLASSPIAHCVHLGGYLAGYSLYLIFTGINYIQYNTNRQMQYIKRNYFRVNFSTITKSLRYLTKLNFTSILLLSCLVAFIVLDSNSFSPYMKSTKRSIQYAFNFIQDVIESVYNAINDIIH